MQYFTGVTTVQLYYDVVFLLSALLTMVYGFSWRKHFDMHITLVYVIIPVANLGFALRAHATNLQEALAMNKICYLGGCFLELAVMLAILSLCGIKLPLILKALFFLLSAGAYLGALTVGQNQLFYTRVTLETMEGTPVLVREYGWMHTLFQGMVILFLTISVAVILYCFVRKTQISRKILVLLLLPELVAIFAFFARLELLPGLELVPAAYVVAQITYLMIAAKIPVYDVTDSAVEALVEDGDTGLIAFDQNYRYLGSNERAKKIFPALKGLTVDGSISRQKMLNEQVKPWLADFREDPAKNTQFFEAGEKIYRVLINWLYTRRHRVRGYQMMVMDDTENQKYVRLLNQYNDDLKRDVDAKTAHIQEMHDRLVLSMATMVESRDNSTGGHIKRTSEGVRLLLDAMDRQKECGRVDRETRKNLIKAAPMHDLGKIAVDDAVLRKPGRFTPEEFGKMKAHAAEGARIVREILKGTDDPEFSRIAENVAHYHHERWDGSGYPEGLKGEEIPREARIMAIADVYDALVSKRVYKEKMSFEKADAIIMEGMGSQFDPALEPVYTAARPMLEKYYSSLEE